MAVLAAACADSSTESSTPPSTEGATEQEQVAARLAELEPRPGEDWDRDSVPDALAAARRLFVLGFDGDAPINFTRLIVWLEEHPGAVTDAEWDRILQEGDGSALGITAVPAAYWDHSGPHVRYQEFADQAEDVFRRLTGHGLGFDACG